MWRQRRDASDKCGWESKMSLPKRFALVLLLISVFPMSAFSQAGAKDQDVLSLIYGLRTQRWEGPYAATIPLQWDLRLTEPMRRILEIGSPAQEALIESIRDPLIKDQIIILLGGVGDERSVGPIIVAMIGKKDLKSIPNSEQVNLAANIALTNITVADVIWHYGGGIVLIDPPEGSKERWKKWWKKNEANFAVKSITQNRNYSNYPNYGIYKQP
jgi:hypothetical protein